MVRSHGCRRRWRNSDWKTPCATPAPAKQYLTPFPRFPGATWRLEAGMRGQCTAKTQSCALRQPADQKGWICRRLIPDAVGGREK